MVGQILADGDEWKRGRVSLCTKRQSDIYQSTAFHEQIPNMQSFLWRFFRRAPQIFFSLNHVGYVAYKHKRMEPGTFFLVFVVYKTHLACKTATSAPSA